MAKYMINKKPNLDFGANLNPPPDPEITRYAPKKRESLDWGIKGD